MREARLRPAVSLALGCGAGPMLATIATATLPSRLHRHSDRGMADNGEAVHVTSAPY